MKNLFQILSLFILFNTQYSFVKAQNLVPNPSFEDTVQCPDGPGQVAKAYPWFQPSNGTPDYFNTCSVYPDMKIPQNFFGYQDAKTGNAYAGLFGCLVYWDSVLPNYREYLEVKLDTSLQSGTDYFVTFFVSLADSMNYSTDDIGVYFSIDTIKNDTGYFISSIVPQIENPQGNFLINKVGWTKIYGKYTALGGEKFLTIGNFKDRYNTDTISVEGGSSNLGQSDWLGGYYYVDDVCVSLDSNYALNWTAIPEYSLSQEIIAYPNPANETLIVKSNSIRNLSIVNIMGQTVYECRLTGITSEVNTTFLSSGIYFLISETKLIQKIIIYHYN